MRRQLLTLLSAAVVACHPSTEVSGMYIQDSAGVLFPCSDAKIAMIVQNAAALTTRYRAATSSNQPMFVRLRGVKAQEGSIYGGQRYFEVQQILELRPRAAGECPGVLPWFSTIVH